MLLGMANEYREPSEFLTSESDDALQAIAERATKDRALAYWTDPNRFPTETDTAFWQIVGTL